MMIKSYFLKSYENREVLAKLKTDSNKNLARSQFFNIPDFRRTAAPKNSLRIFLTANLVSKLCNKKNSRALTSNMTTVLQYCCPKLPNRSF